MDFGIRRRVRIWLDAGEILSHPRHWRPIRREEARHVAAHFPVAMIVSRHGFESAAWFDPFEAVGPWARSRDSRAARYFRYLGLVGEEKEVRFTPSPKGEQKEEVWEPIAKRIEESVGDDPSPKKKKRFPVEFQLVNGAGKAFPPTAYKLTFPDGKLKEGKSDSEGFIRYPENEQEGEVKLELVGEKAASSPPIEAPDKHLIEIQLKKADGKALAHAKYRITLPDESVKEGESDGEGFVRIPDNEQSGELELVLVEFEKKEEA